MTYFAKKFDQAGKPSKRLRSIQHAPHGAEAAALIKGIGLLPLCLSLSIFSSTLFALEPCRIEVVEKGSGWPVPLVELRTTHQVRLITDNAGVVAFDLPELMGRETWFDVIGHGYERAKDGFGSRGVRLTPEPGRRSRWK